ncbi:hypothetical protein DL96DRAFT_1818409 [Flagelloscypha sp. PMI_526]|nr:hypothetical protein DL96DRAFT_1818409 [Flagelloscypha sp. PMI_526]
MVAFLELPPELQREIVTYCNTASQLACCLTSHTLLENSRPTLYHRIQLDDHRVQVFVARALHHIALVRRLHASFGGISGPHIAETEWVILLEGLIQCQALETLDLIPSGYNFTQQSKVIDVTLERLSLLPSLRSVMDMFPSTQERLPEPASWHRLFYWGTRLNGARMRIHYGELLPLAVKLPNRPILHTLQIDGKFQPWNSFEPPFEFHSLRYLSIVLDDGFDNLYEEILNAASASLQRVSFAWLIGGRETARALHDVPLIRHLHASFGGIQAPHIAESDWITLFKELLQCQALETLDLIPSGYSYTQHSQAVDEAVEKLTLLPSLRSVMDQSPTTSQVMSGSESWHRLFRWGARLNGVRLRTQDNDDLLLHSLEVHNRPILHTLQIDGKFQPWKPSAPPFDFHSLRYLSIVVEEGFDDQYDEIMDAGSASLRMASFAWLMGGRESGLALQNLTKTFKSLTILTLVVPDSPFSYVPLSSMKTFLSSVMERAPNLQTLRIYFIGTYMKQTTHLTSRGTDKKPWDDFVECFSQFSFNTIQLWFSFGKNWDDESRDLAILEIARSYNRLLRTPGRLQIFWHRKILWREIWEGNLKEEYENILEQKAGISSGDPLGRA